MNVDNWITAVLSLRKTRKVVVFTGAGISQESGIPTFRTEDGLWSRFPPEQFANWNGLFKTAITQPRTLAEFVHQLIEPIAVAEPNRAHRAIAELNQFVPTTVVTQNIDGLHQEAGSEAVHEIHGSLLEIVDSSTGKLATKLSRAQLREISQQLLKFQQGETSLWSFIRKLSHDYPVHGLLRYRPNLVLFGEAMAEPAWEEACRAVANCDLLITVGTSGTVYPAALLPLRAAEFGRTVIVIDPVESAGCWLAGQAGDILPRLINDAFANRK